MFWTFFAGIGKLLLPLIASIAPWGGPKFGMALAFALGALVVVGGPAGAVWLNMRGEVKVAVSQCESSCTLRISRMETAAERTIADILSSVEPETSENVVEYCRRNPGLCRSDK